MTKCEVTAVFNPKGQPHPTRVVWGEQPLIVEAIGRRWASESGQHVLARVTDGRVFELVYNAVEWQGKVVSQPPQFS